MFCGRFVVPSDVPQGTTVSFTCNDHLGATHTDITYMRAKTRINLSNRCYSFNNHLRCAKYLFMILLLVSLVTVQVKWRVRHQMWRTADVTIICVIRRNYTKTRYTCNQERGEEWETQEPRSLQVLSEGQVQPLSE